MAKKSGLGKGLDALFLDNETAESSSLMTLRVSDIEPNKDQPRKAFEPNALAELADSIREHGVMNAAICDEIPSVLSLIKTYSITGWRLGYAIAPQPIMDRIKQYHDFNTVGAPSPLMEAAVVGLDMPDSYYQEFGAHYAHMKKLFTDGLKQIGIPFTDPQGAYFVLADIGPYMRKGESDVDFCLEMAEKVGVACVPGTSFFNENINHIVRVHFAKKDETLYEALERLSHLKEKMG